MIYPLTLFATVFGVLRRCPQCGKVQVIKKELRQSVCKKCGRSLTLRFAKRGSV